MTVPFSTLTFHDPAWLVLMLVPLVLLYLEFARAARWRVAVPTVVALPARVTLRSTLRRALPALRACGLAALVVAMARPVGDRSRSPMDGQGIDIALLVDVSSSMKAEDMSRDESRIDVVKRVLRQFIKQRDGDRMGIIAFARYPVTVCPFTLDNATVAQFANTLQPVTLVAEDGTAIGVALAQAARRLKKSSAKSRIVVLLTDGANNVDDITPDEGAKLAAEMGIRVYTILAGREEPNNVFRMFAEERIDPKPLIDIARTTGGKFFRAEDAQSLQGIYKEIDRLEKSKLREARYENFTDFFWVFASQGIAFLFAAAALDHTWLRRLP